MKSTGQNPQDLLLELLGVEAVAASPAQIESMAATCCSISLTKPENWNPNAGAEEAQALEDFRKATTAPSDLGSLGSLFDNLKL